MNRIVGIALATLFLTTEITHAAVFTENLYFGLEKNSEVTKLQEFLTTEGLYSGPITGNFYSLTLNGVKAFQIREGVTPTAGFFGPITREKANAIIDSEISNSQAQAVMETGSTPQPPQTPKTTDDVVSFLQQQIATLLQQVNILQQQLQTQQQTQQTVQKLQEQVTQQIQVIQEQNSQPKEVDTSKATVVLEGNVETGRICVKEGDTYKCGNFSQWSKGMNADSNRKTIRQYEPLPYPVKPLLLSVWSRDEATKLRILVNVNNHTNDNPSFNCEKFGNRYWIGLTTPKDHWEENVLSGFSELEDGGSTTFEFGVRCTNSDGSTSSDSLLVRVINSDIREEISPEDIK